MLASPFCVAQNFPRSRAALSLMGYCHYQSQDYRNAATMYEQLCRICPDVDEYKIYLAQVRSTSAFRSPKTPCTLLTPFSPQSLYKAAMYPEAMRAVVRVDNPQYAQRMLLLQASIKYEQVRSDHMDVVCKGVWLRVPPPPILGRACLLQEPARPVPQ
jgi:hypothetical protein